MQIFITDSTLSSFHHLPENQDRVELKGLTLRQALSVLRDIDFGDLGGTYDIMLSDNTTISVCLEPDSGGGHVMCSQKARRYRDCGCTLVRKYNL